MQAAFIGHIHCRGLLLLLPLLASDEGERARGGERVVPRDALVGDAVRHRPQQEQERRLRLRRRGRPLLPRRRRVPHHPILLLGRLAGVQVGKSVYTHQSEVRVTEPGLLIQTVLPA